MSIALTFSHGIHPTVEKVKAIQDAHKPTNVTPLRTYLGLLKFYRRFIPNVATMLEPLNVTTLVFEVIKQCC